MIYPSPVARSDGRAAWQTRNVPITFVVSTVFQWSTVSASTAARGTGPVTPALLTTPSTPRPPLEGGIDERPCGERPADIALHVHAASSAASFSPASTDETELITTRAPGRQLASDGVADPAARPGDDDRLAGEVPDCSLACPCAPTTLSTLSRRSHSPPKKKIVSSFTNRLLTTIVERVSLVSTMGV
jgi:hypothetical protein